MDREAPGETPDPFTTQIVKTTMVVRDSTRNDRQ